MTDQEAAFAKLERLKVGALFMETGTGKTKVALDLIASREGLSYALWICPFSVKGSIEAERRKWHLELELDIVGCESIGSSARVFLEVQRKVRSGRSFIVVDESLKIKNRDAKRTQRILELGRDAEYRLILNGTPLSRNVLDLWAQMQFLSPKILGMTWNEFRDSYCEYYVRGRLKGLVKRQHNIPHLVAKLEPYIFDAELDINSTKNYYNYGYGMDDREGYEEVKETLMAGCRENGIDFMAVCTVLQRFYTSSRSRRAVLDEVLEGIDGQAIVFVKYLGSIPPGADAFTGAEDAKSRERLLEGFRNGDIRTLWMTYGCGAFGLNLQHCRNMVFAEHTFDYAQRLQAEARIYRKGQEMDVNYYSLWCDCGLERLIRRSQDKKENLLDEVKRNIGGREWIKSL